MTREISAIFGRGALASRPAAGNSGDHYFATDIGQMYRDNGASWDAESPLLVALGNVTLTTTQIAANTDNYSPTGLSVSSLLRMSSDASRNLTGIATGTAGRMLLLCNIGAQDIVLKHDATSTAANRFYCPGSTDVTLTPNSCRLLAYDGTSSRWRVVGA